MCFKKSLTSVSEALGTAEPGFLDASKMFFNSAFSALSYKYNNKNAESLYGDCYVGHTFQYLTWKRI
jgi:hypothetical protein